MLSTLQTVDEVIDCWLCGGIDEHRRIHRESDIAGVRYALQDAIVDQRRSHRFGNRRENVGPRRQIDTGRLTEQPVFWKAM